MRKYIGVAAALLSTLSQLDAFCLAHSLGPHTFYVGPEFAHYQRKREGGSKQSGHLVGGHFRYDRISPCSFYWALDAHYDTGWASGKTASGSKIKSTLNEYEFEGRLGYSFFKPTISNLLIIPYATYSYFYGLNEFHKPSPVRCKLHDHLNLAGGGLWVSFCLTDCCRVGIDFTGKYIVSGKNRITDDPDYDDVKLAIESKWQYEIEVPIEFSIPCCDRCLEFRFVPFYSFRHLGGKPNYPFDYIETKYKIYGAQFMLFLGF